MNTILRRDPRTVIPDFIDWFEEPFLTLRPYLGQPIRIEDYTEDGHYVVRAEIAGIDPEKELEVSAGAVSACSAQSPAAMTARTVTSTSWSTSARTVPSST